MYRDTAFSVEGIAQVEKDLQEAQAMYPRTKRVFLVNGDAFVLSAKRLKPIAELIHKYLPQVEMISMYASINNIMGKTDEELAELNRLGIGDLWVGVETGLPDALAYLNKGANFEETYQQLERLNRAGISFYYGFMFGAAGKGRGIENAEANAKLINKLKPVGIVPTTLSPNEGTQLEKDIADGRFELASEREVLKEQIKTLELINVANNYMGIHIINSVSFDAQLPQQREWAIQRVENTIEALDEAYLNSVPQRHTI